MNVFEEAANTFIELIVTLTIMMIVGSMVYAIYLHSTRSVNRWQKRMALENQTHLLMNRLAMDLRDGADLEHVTNQTWLIRKYDQENTVYAYADRRLFRNDEVLQDSTSQVSRFEIDPLDIKSSTIMKGAAFQITIRSEKDSLSLASKAFFREQIHWRPIADRLPH